MKSAKTERTPGGRPPKFKEPSGPVTVTLPKRTLDQLRSIDDDRAIAIVKAVDAAVGSGRGHALQIEVNRSLYMDEFRLEPNRGFDRLSADLGKFAAALLAFVEEIASARQAAE